MLITGIWVVSACIRIPALAFILSVLILVVLIGYCIKKIFDRLPVQEKKDDKKN